MFQKKIDFYNQYKMNNEINDILYLIHSISIRLDHISDLSPHDNEMTDIIKNYTNYSSLLYNKLLNCYYNNKSIKLIDSLNTNPVYNPVYNPTISMIDNEELISRKRIRQHSYKSIEYAKYNETKEYTDIYTVDNYNVVENLENIVENVIENDIYKMQPRDIPINELINIDVRKISKKYIFVHKKFAIRHNLIYDTPDHFRNTIYSNNKIKLYFMNYRGNIKPYKFYDYYVGQDGFLYQYRNELDCIVPAIYNNSFQKWRYDN